MAAPNGAPVVGLRRAGATPDITVARIHMRPALYKAAADGLPTLADEGYIGAGIGIHVAVCRPKGRSEIALDRATHATNALTRYLRARGERTVAELKERWRTLKHVAPIPSRIGDVACAALALNRHWK
ncbi:transposase family protein [Streptomyces sp. NPDC058000]|uniref:transposase family protein n=1 Tax=Streptomyces sp. NPDC058000 TaxID=3346299 RepID=UPI0036E6C12F